MKTPRYTDMKTYPKGGYVKSDETDISKTFDRIREEFEDADIEQDLEHAIAEAEYNLDILEDR